MLINTNKKTEFNQPRNANNPESISFNHIHDTGDNFMIYTVQNRMFLGDNYKTKKTVLGISISATVTLEKYQTYSILQ